METEGYLDREFRHEELKDKEGRRKARERKEKFSLIERGAGLLMAAACLAVALINHSYVPSIPALGWGLGRALISFARRG